MSGKQDKQAKQDKQKVLVCFIQDRSGSMQTVWSETLNGYKVFVDKLKEEKNVDYLFSLTTFDTEIDTPLAAVPLDKVTGKELEKFGPRGSTALYDAVGTTIEKTEKKRHDTHKVICVVVTDGQENSSREWTKGSLQKAVEARLDAGDWTFTYLGTQPETWDDAHGIGVGIGSTTTYSGKHARAAYNTVAMAVNKLADDSMRLNTRSMMDDYVPDATAATSSMATSSVRAQVRKRIYKQPVAVSPAKPTPTSPAKAKKWRKVPTN